MYEKTRPDRLPGPGGILHLDQAEYIPHPDGRTVSVRGSRFVPTPGYQVKLEGARKLGYRTTFIGGIRDPVLIEELDGFLEMVEQTTRSAFPQSYQLIFHIYGRNAVMGSREPSTHVPHEIGLLGEVLADSQSVADSVAGFARTIVLHGAYDGQLATAGNLASPLTPLEQQVGPVFEFSVYHLMEVDTPLALFPIAYFSVGNANSASKPLEPRIPPRPRQPPRQLATSAKNWSNVTTKAKTQGKTIAKIASVVRSKNSGPFEITLDILFEKKEDFLRVRDSGTLTRDLMKKLYHLNDNDIQVQMFYEPALGWKCTFKRPWKQGSVGERDVFGAQQHAPLLDIEIP